MAPVSAPSPALAERIAAQVLTHPQAAEVTVTIEKLDRVPGALGVTLTRRTPQVEVQAQAVRPALLVMGRRIALPPGPLVILPPAPGLPVPQGGDQRRIALLALDQGAWALAGALGLDVADSRTEIDWAAANGLAVVWAPCRMAADADVPATPGLLALWLADRLDAPRIDWALPEGAALPPEAAGFRIPSVLLGA